MKKGMNVVLGVIAHWDIDPSIFNAAAKGLFDGLLTGMHVATVRALYDRAPTLGAWCKRQVDKSRVAFVPITTPWQEMTSAQAVKTRNGEFFPGLHALYIIGEIKHRTAFEAVKRALQSDLSIFQVDLGMSNPDSKVYDTIVKIRRCEATSEIRAIKGFDIGSLDAIRRMPKVEAESEPDMWNRLAGEKKARKEKAGK